MKLEGEGYVWFVYNENTIFTETLQSYDLE